MTGEAWASSAGFTASYAGTPVLPAAVPGLAGNVWHHIALSVTASGRLSLVINGTQQLTQQLPWDPAPVQNPLTRGTDATAIGRGAPAWQDGGDVGHACLEVDELRFWTEARTASDIGATMTAGCQAVAAGAAGHALAACYSFDAAGSTSSFTDASQNQIPALTAAHGSPHKPWCVNMDDAGELRLDELIVSTGLKTTCGATARASRGCPVPASTTARPRWRKLPPAVSRARRMYS